MPDTTTAQGQLKLYRVVYEIRGTAYVEARDSFEAHELITGGQAWPNSDVHIIDLAELADTINLGGDVL